MIIYPKCILLYKCHLWYIKRHDNKIHMWSAGSFVLSAYSRLMFEAAASINCVIWMVAAGARRVIQSAQTHFWQNYSVKKTEIIKKCMAQSLHKYMCVAQLNSANIFLWHLCRTLFIISVFLAEIFCQECFRTLWKLAVLGGNKRWDFIEISHF